MQLIALTCLLAVFFATVSGQTGQDQTTVTSIGDSLPPGMSYLTHGGTFDIYINFSGPISTNSSSNPPYTLTLSNGAVATYVSGGAAGAPTSTLTFDYTVPQDQPDGFDTSKLDVASLVANGDLSGEANVTDGNGNQVNFTLPIGVDADVFTNNIVVIDTFAPYVTSANVTKGNYTIGSEIPLFVTFSEAVEVVDNPQVQIGPFEFQYAGHVLGDNSTLRFVYTVTSASGDQSLQDVYTNGGSNAAFDFTDGYITDEADNKVNVTAGELGTQIGLLNTQTVFAQVLIQSSVGLTTVISITGSPSDTTVNVSQVVTITLTFDRPVTLLTTAGAITLALNNGGVAYFVGTSGVQSDTAVFRYTVLANDGNTTNLDVANATDSLHLAVGDNIFDVNNNAINDTLPIGPDNPNSLFNSNIAVNDYQGNVIIVNATVQSITCLNSTTDSNSNTILYFSGQRIVFAVTFSDVVMISDNATLALNNGGFAYYQGGASSSTIDFVYYVRSQDSTTDLQINNRNALAAYSNDGNARPTITDQTNNNNVDLTIPNNVNLNCGFTLVGTKPDNGALYIVFEDTFGCGTTGLNSDIANIESIVNKDLGFTFYSPIGVECSTIDVNANSQHYISNVTLEFDVYSFNNNKNDINDNEFNTIADAINALNGNNHIDVTAIYFNTYNGQGNSAGVMVPTLFGMAAMFLAMLMRN